MTIAAVIWLKSDYPGRELTEFASTNFGFHQKLSS